jgi:fructan beta-fructosidase
MGGESLDVRIFFDRASAELFAAGGRLNMTEVFFPSSPYTDLRLWTRGGELVLRDGRVYGLDPIWGAGQPAK